MIVYIHIIQENGEKLTSNIQVTGSFKQTIAQKITQSKKSDVYVSGISKIELTLDNRKESGETPNKALTVTRIDNGVVKPSRYNVPTDEISSIIDIKDSDTTLCLDKIAACVDQHCLNSEPIWTLRGSLSTTDPAQAAKVLASLSSIFSQFANDQKEEGSDGGDDNPRAGKKPRI